MMLFGALKTLVDGTLRIFSASGRTGETFDQRELIQHYGFASSPKTDAQLLILVEGNVITCIGSDDRRYRIALASGEAALYDDLGQKAHLTRDGIEVESPLKATLTAPEVMINASTGVTMNTPLLQVTGQISDDTRTMAADRAIYIGHHHDHPADGVIIPPPNEAM